MSKKIILTIMTFAILLAGVLGINTKASAAKESTNRKSIDVIVGYKNYIRKVKVNGKITQLKYDKNYLKLTKKGNKIKFSEAFKAGKTTVTVKCKGCKTSKITVKIWKNEEAWENEFARRYINNKKLEKTYSKIPKKYQKLIINNYDSEKMAAAKKAAGKYIEIKFYKGTKDLKFGKYVLLCNKYKKKKYCEMNILESNYTARILSLFFTPGVVMYMYLNPDGSEYDESNYYDSLRSTIPDIEIEFSCEPTNDYEDSIYNDPFQNGILYTNCLHDKNHDVGDEKALKKIIEAQVASGAIISTDLSNSGNYTWDKQTGRLIGIKWPGENLKGAVSFSKLTALKELNCSFNQLTSLDVSGNKALKELNCRHNQITSLDVSGCTALETLNCVSNQLTSLDVSRNKALKELRLDEKVDLIGVSKDCNVQRGLPRPLDSDEPTVDTDFPTPINPGNPVVVGNKNASDVEALTEIIEEQVASGANISRDLDSSDYTWDIQTGRLTGIWWAGHNLKGAISFSKLTALRDLDCYENQLTKLDVNGNTALTTLNCSGNQLTSLDVSGNKDLMFLYCQENQLASLDVSKNTNLAQLYLDADVNLIGVSKNCNVIKNEYFDWDYE